MKNKFLIVVLILALFIPTYIGIYSYIDTKRTPVTPDSAAGLVISDIAAKPMRKRRTATSPRF